MSPNPIDFQGIIHLDRKIISQVREYLEIKQNHLAIQLLEIARLSLPNPSDSVALLPIRENIRLEEVVESFEKIMRSFYSQLSPFFIKPKQFAFIKEEIDRMIQEYAEILEDFSKELFNQILSIPIEKWSHGILSAGQEMKELLVRYLDHLIWAIQRIEASLEEYDLQSRQKQRHWFTLFLFHKSQINARLVKNLEAIKDFLTVEFVSFTHRYNEYSNLNAIAEKNFYHMKKFPVLALLELPEQGLYFNLYRLLKIYELNPKPAKAVGVATAWVIKTLAPAESISRLFKIYFKDLQSAFFKCSREWKFLNQDEKSFDSTFHALKNKIRDYEKELREFIELLSHYRLFVLRTDSNPYIRSRWGFSEWIVGPEPASSKEILELIYDGEGLEKNFRQLVESLALHGRSEEYFNDKVKTEVNRLLHEIGQPLHSQSMIKKRAEELLRHLNLCNEIGSKNPAVISFMSYSLSKAMKEDWKYHVLHGMALFHRIYEQHLGLIDKFEDAAHRFRMEQFQQLFDRVEGWIRKGEMDIHLLEVEVNNNDLKSYLQSFLALAQKAIKEGSQNPHFEETLAKLRQQLVDYRYMFGNFLFSLGKYDPNGFLLRHQLLFVDQCFEAVGNLIGD